MSDELNPSTQSGQFLEHLLKAAAANGVATLMDLQVGYLTTFFAGLSVKILSPEGGDAVIKQVEDLVRSSGVGGVGSGRIDYDTIAWLVVYGFILVALIAAIVICFQSCCRARRRNSIASSDAARVQHHALLLQQNRGSRQLSTSKKTVLVRVSAKRRTQTLTSVLPDPSSSTVQQQWPQHLNVRSMDESSSNWVSGRGSQPSNSQVIAGLDGGAPISPDTYSKITSGTGLNFDRGQDSVLLAGQERPDLQLLTQDSKEDEIRLCSEIIHSTSELSAKNRNKITISSVRRGVVDVADACADDYQKHAGNSSSGPGKYTGEMGSRQHSAVDILPESFF